MASSRVCPLICRTPARSEAAFRSAKLRIEFILLEPLAVITVRLFAFRGSVLKPGPPYSAMNSLPEVEAPPGNRSGQETTKCFPPVPRALRPRAAHEI